MAFLQTNIRSGYITDLVLPPAQQGQDPATILEQGLAAIFASIHSPTIMINLNPLVQSVNQIPESDPKSVDYREIAPSFDIALDAPYVILTQDESDPKANTISTNGFRQFEIVDKLNIGFGMTQNLVYHAAIRQTRFGMETFTNAGSGVVIFGRWEIKVADGGRVINIIEKNVVRCNLLLSWYIRSTIDKSHAEAHAKLKEKWIVRMKEVGFDPMPRN
ncbi:hypothetical protein B0A52_01313 [Exophiala mesophila]|uniref:DUF7053 domain-containing protein n=1 Tax=Exophiala mesophila TaxID=212818 RepID=A0A438NH44_EXOME|nr:hypothetical protein B0A52_01313 [Exophiala mesophila]